MGLEVLEGIFNILHAVRDFVVVVNRGRYIKCSFQYTLFQTLYSGHQFINKSTKNKNSH